MEELTIFFSQNGMFLILKSSIARWDKVSSLSYRNKKSNKTPHLCRRFEISDNITLYLHLNLCFYCLIEQSSNRV